VLASALLWWHAVSRATRAFAVVGGPWGWTSHLTSYYFERAAALTDSCARQLVRREPDPPRGTRFFFATLPPWAGFQMGNGALIRHLYRDSTLESHFYSQFSERTAGDRPCRFLYWDGRELLPLYAASRDLFFQVGGDLLLQDRLDGAAHAFRRGLASGENRLDHLYWLGWCDLWRGNRDAAESAWTSFGARDDTLAFSSHIVAAQAALLDRADTLAARRELFAAVRAAIGRPEAHAVLGELLLESQPKYGMLELKVACWLKPDDWWARRALVLGLIAARLDEPARRELVTLEKQYLGFGADSVLARARRTLMDRTPTAGMAEF
jgi:hypothetical protein